MKLKSDVSTVFPNFVSFVENQFGTSVKCVRTDNAQELCEGDLKMFLLRKGIDHHRSCPDTPQQNGVVERKHRHLLETSRALFFQSKLPITYWNECVLCAAHTINRMPLKILSNKSPYEKLFGVAPNLDYLRAFGCLCFVSSNKQGRTKFDSKASIHVFIGYSPGQKGYKVLSMDTFKIHTSRDVVFKEQHFLFHFYSTPRKHPYPFFLPMVTSFTS